MCIALNSRTESNLNIISIGSNLESFFQPIQPFPEMQKVSWILMGFKSFLIYCVHKSPFIEHSFMHMRVYYHLCPFHVEKGDRDTGREQIFNKRQDNGIKIRDKLHFAWINSTNIVCQSDMNPQLKWN